MAERMNDDMKKQKMLLITHGYPFGESEYSFLSSEIKVLETNYDLTVMAVCLPDADISIKHGGKRNFRTVRFIYKRKYPKKYIMRVIADKAAVKEMLSMLPDIARVRNVLGFVKRSIVIKDVLEKIIRKNGADIIYTFWCTEETYAALQLKRKYPHLKVISRLHGYDLYKERNPFCIQPMHKTAASKADLLVFISKNGERYFKKEFPGTTETMVSYLGSGDFGRIKKGSECSYTIVSCSNIIGLKRLGRITEALSRSGVGLRWIHIGEGERSEIEQQYAHKLLDGSSCTFEFLGIVPNDKIAEIYHKNAPDLFINASSTEGLPVSIMEAFSCGIPVIAPDVGGISEIVSDGINGYLMSAEAAPDELVSAIERFYSLSDEERMAMAENAHKTFLAAFNAQTNAEEFVKALKKRFQ